MKLEIWQIPRKDTRERCFLCLAVFRKGQFKHRDKRFNGYRFKNVCGKCKI